MQSTPHTPNCEVALGTKSIKRPLDLQQKTPQTKKCLGSSNIKSLQKSSGAHQLFHIEEVGKKGGIIVSTATIHGHPVIAFRDGELSLLTDIK